MRVLGSARRLVPWLQRGLPLILGGFCLWILHGEYGHLSFRLIAMELASIEAWRLGAALATMALSFMALAHYDIVAHRHLKTNLPGTKARRAGASAIAIGQFTGFGPVVGAAIRWRLMPALGHRGVLKLTTFVTLSFMVAWTVIAATLALPAAYGLPYLSLALLPLGIGAVGAGLFWFPEARISRLKLRLPSLPASGRILVLSFADLFFAATTLALLLPPGSGDLWQIFGIYTLALGAGLIGGTPGGLGPFELTFALLLPVVDTPALLASFLAFRLVYYAVPLLAGLAYAVLSTPMLSAPAVERQAAPRRGTQAEHGLTSQTPSYLLQGEEGSSAAVLVETQTLMLMRGPLSGTLPQLLNALKARAKSENRLACLYKLQPREAAQARKQGWQVQPFATEAWLNPQAFSVSVPERRQLRRLLRKGEQAGLSVRRLSAPDWPALSEINEAWALSHGGERGLTMGRFCPSFLEDKPLFAAFLAGEPIAFISFLDAPGAWSLDLMRHRDDVPPGTMQMLLVAALEQARREGLTELCLAALPHSRFDGMSEKTEGLKRFKTAFAPRWRSLYIAAPDLASLAMAGLSIWRSIRTPGPLPALQPAARWSSPEGRSGVQDAQTNPDTGRGSSTGTGTGTGTGSGKTMVLDDSHRTGTWPDPVHKRHVSQSEAEANKPKDHRKRA